MLPDRRAVRLNFFQHPPPVNILRSKLIGAEERVQRRPFSGACPNKVQNLPTPPSLGRSVARTLSLPMVQTATNKVDVDQAALVVVVAIFKAEGE